MTRDAESTGHSPLCWSATGTLGDRSCPEIGAVGSCSHCPEFRSAGRRLLQREVPAEYRQEWSRRLAESQNTVEDKLTPYFVFRIGLAWLCLPVACMMETAAPSVIRTLPHKRTELLLGLTVVRGEILPCVSLHALLAEEPGSPRRFLVVRSREGKLVFPVDEVMGVQELAGESLAPLPANLAHAEVSFTKGILSCQDKQVGLLDDEMLFGMIERRIA